MELRQLQTFLTIVEYNNFTRAAEELGYAQSTVTTQIKKLEEHFDKQLFERIGKNIFLTEYGHKLLPIAKEMTRLNKEANLLIGKDDSVSGTINIATPESLCINWFPNIYKNLNAIYPDIDLELRMYSCEENIELLQNNEVDLAFVINNANIAKELKTLVEWNMEMCLLASPYHEIAKEGLFTFEALNNQRLILTEAGCSYRDVIESTMNKNHIIPKEIMTVKSIQVIKQLVMSGYGIGYLPEFAVNNEISNNDVVALDWEGVDIDFSINLVCHSEKWITKRMKAFVEIALMITDKLKTI